MKLLSQIVARPVRLLAVLLLSMLVLMGAGDDSARVESLGHKLICMCGCNQILLECNHYGCPYLTPMQKQVVASVAAGKSDDDILRSFIDEYGTTVLSAPTTNGFDRVAWLMPYVVLFLGIGSVVSVVYVWHKRRTVPSPAPARSISADFDRLREQARRETEL